MELRYSKPLYNEVLSITNDFLCPSYSKIQYMKKNLEITKPRFWAHILPVPEGLVPRETVNFVSLESQSFPWFCLGKHWDSLETKLPVFNHVFYGKKGRNKKALAFMHFTISYPFEYHRCPFIWCPPHDKASLFSLVLPFNITWFTENDTR